MCRAGSRDCALRPPPPLTPAPPRPCPHSPCTAGGSVRAVKVARKKGPDGKPLSAGFGFVECSSEAAAAAAVKALQGSALDGHKLVLQLAKGGGGADAGGKGKAAGLKGPGTSKMVVCNVAFEATRKDIVGLFAPFGQIKSARLPRKFDGTHRCAGRAAAGCRACWRRGAPRLPPLPAERVCDAAARACAAPCLPLPQRLCVCRLCHQAGGPQCNGGGAGGYLAAAALAAAAAGAQCAAPGSRAHPPALPLPRSLQGAHLYGRRLVIEWAEEEGGLDELRAKTGAAGEWMEARGRRGGRGRGAAISRSSARRPAGPSIKHAPTSLSIRSRQVPRRRSAGAGSRGGSGARAGSGAWQEEEEGSRGAPGGGRAGLQEASQEVGCRPAAHLHNFVHSCYQHIRRF